MTMLVPPGELADTTRSLRVGPDLLIQGAPTGPLAGTATVIKDLFDVAGQHTGAGNPDWLADSSVSTANAWAVEAWVEAGASVVGISHSDELAFSLSGTNVHYGTPVNPLDPERIPGGSSSGSAVAVASGLVDYALATDTGGSTRVPASYCGIFGLRSSHGRIPLTGAVGLAPRFDTVGVLAATGAQLATAASVLLDATRAGSGGADAVAEKTVTGVVIASDVLALADPDTADIVGRAAEQLAAHLGVPLSRRVLGGERLPIWRDYFMARQMADIWATHGHWVTTREPQFGPGVASRMGDASRADPQRAALADIGRAEVLAALDAVLPPGAVLAFASASGPAPRIDLDAETKGALRGRTIAMTCIAGLGGLPAVSLPLGVVDGLPVGLCLIARPGEDELLLAIARAADGLRGKAGAA